MCGLSVAGFVYYTTSIQFFDSVRIRTQSIAALLDESHFDTLTLSDQDLTSPDYIHLKEEMIGVKKYNPDTRFMYLIARRDNTIYFIGDSESPTSPDYSPPGQVFTEASRGLHTAIEHHLLSYTEDASDRWGHWISTFAPVATNRIDITVYLGIDVGATAFYTTLYTELGLIGLSTLLLIGFIYGLQRGRRKEHELEEMRADFVAIASHELRSPLTAMRWSLATLQKDITLSVDATRIVNDFYNRICALINHTSTFLATAAADHGVMNKKSFVICNMQHIVAEAVDSAQSIAQVKGSSIDARLSEAPSLTVVGDPVRLRLAIDNLLGNAIKYSPEHTAISVSTTYNATQCMIAIQDHGMGIPAGELADVFKGFHRASNATRSNAIGTGFGLYMVKKIVEFHGGNLVCTSVIHEGTTFTITLPLHG
jgi:signal transduction histidine kinase